jgi:hypothetical protein
VAELVDAADSKSAFFGSGGSSPPLGTKKRPLYAVFFCAQREGRVPSASDKTGLEENRNTPGFDEAT